MHDSLSVDERNAFQTLRRAIEQLEPLGYWVGCLGPDDVLHVDPALTRAAAVALIRDHYDDWTEYLTGSEYARDLIAEILEEKRQRRYAPDPRPSAGP